MRFFGFLTIFCDFFCTLRLARTARSARASRARRAFFENLTTSFPLLQKTFEHPQKIHPCHPDYKKNIGKCITRMVPKWTKTKKYQKKRTGPKPTTNDGEKMTVKRNLLLTRQNDNRKASKNEDGEKRDTRKSWSILPKKSSKYSSDPAPPAHAAVPK